MLTHSPHSLFPLFTSGFHSSSFARPGLLPPFPLPLSLLCFSVMSFWHNNTETYFNSTVLVPLVMTHGPKPIATVLWAFAGLVAGYWGIALYEEEFKNEFDALMIMVTSPVGALNLAFASLLNLPLFYMLICIGLTVYGSSWGTDRKRAYTFMAIPSFVTLIVAAYYHHLEVLSPATWIELGIFLVIGSILTYFSTPILDGLYGIWVDLTYEHAA